LRIKSERIGKQDEAIETHNQRDIETSISGQKQELHNEMNNNTRTGNDLGNAKYNTFNAIQQNLIKE
jgi:hypothetical protein